MKGSEIISLLPRGMRDEIASLGASRGEPEELRLRAGRVSALCFSGGSVALRSRIDGAELMALLATLTGESLYLYRDSLKQGYITLPSGIRLGVASDARYDRGQKAGVGDVDSVVIRFRFGRCSFRGELLEHFKESQNMLILSPPGGGKTTALCALIGEAGRLRPPGRFVVVDERRELWDADCGEWSVDRLRGFKRCEGVEIALRTLGAECIFLDEICSEEDCRAIALAVGSGCRIIATAHSSSHSELYRKRPLAELLRGEVFDRILLIERRAEGRRLRPLVIGGERV